MKYNFKGFNNEQIVLYDLDKNDSSNYITELERWQSRTINNHYNIILDDKLIFYEFFKDYLNIAENIFRTSNNKVFDLNGSELFEKEFENLLLENKEIFVKPIIGGSGRGVFKISYENSVFYLNDEIRTLKEIFKIVKSEEGYVGTKGIKQEGYANKIFPGSVNTIRVVTYYDRDTNKVSIPVVVHRIGTSKTGVLDNAGVGGLVSSIDLQTGMMSEAKNILNETFDHHPDTNEPIKGVVVPGWKQVRQYTKSMAHKFSYIPFMAWDIVLTEGSIKVIEINASSDIYLFQLWDGQRNSELGRVFKKEKIIS